METPESCPRKGMPPTLRHLAKKETNPECHLAKKKAILSVERFIQSNYGHSFPRVRDTQWGLRCWVYFNAAFPSWKLSKKDFVSLRDWMIAERKIKIFTCLFTGNLAFNFKSAKSPCQLSHSCGLKMMLLATWIRCMYSPCRNTWQKSKCVMSTDFHSNLVNCWQSRSRSYFVVELIVLHLHWTCGFTIQFPWGWTDLLFVSWEVLPSVDSIVNLWY